MPEPNLPSFSQLPVTSDAPPGSAWGLWGADDQVGTINLLTPDKVLAAARLIRTGKVFRLDLPLEIPSPALFRRQSFSHHIIGSGVARDDYVDQFYLQSSSQWDGLTHIAHPEHGFYNHTPAEAITGGEDTRLGIEHWARRGIVGRAVLADVARYCERQGRPLDALGPTRVPLADVEATLASQNVSLHAGDILLLRFGWTAAYRALDETGRVELAAQRMRAPAVGLDQSPEMAAYLWDQHIAAVASDAPSVEAFPPKSWEADGFLHYTLIALFGMAMGELWELDTLAADCARDGVYECFLTSAPLNIRGGVGSPPNALAIK